MKLTTLIFLIIYSINIFSQKDIFSKLTVDEKNFINYYIEDTQKLNQISNGIKVGYWINYDTNGRIASIYYHEYNDSKYFSKGEVSMVKRKDKIINKTKFKIDIIFDNIYDKNTNIKFSEDIVNLKACYDTSLYFQMNNQRILLKKDTMLFIKLNGNCSGTRLKNTYKYEIFEDGMLCSDTKYHNIKINIDNHYILLSNLMNVRIFEFNYKIYIFSFQNCMNRLRVYKVSPQQHIKE